MKKAIIIGATSGIGKALTDILLSRGYTIGATGRRINLLQSLQEEYAGKLFVRRMDVQDISAIPVDCNTLVEQMGGIDLFIICAGIGEGNKKLDFLIENEVIKTNIQGFTCLADWSMHFFKKQGYGHIVNISSIAGIRGNGIAPSYNASKAYQINYLEGLRINANKSNGSILVTDIRPGFVDTDMAKGNGMFWVASAEKAAKQIFTAILQKKKVAYITKRWRLIAILLRIIPYSLYKKF